MFTPPSISPTRPRVPLSRSRPSVTVALLFCALLALSSAPSGHAQSPRLPYPADALVFLSGEAIDRILSAADLTEYQLPGANHVHLKVIKLRTAFEQSPGLLQATLEASLPGGGPTLMLQASGRLEQERNPETGGRLLLRPTLTELRPQLSGKVLDDTLRLVATTTIKAGLNALAAAMPALDFELRRNVSIEQPGSSHTVAFDIGQAEVQGQLQVPPLAIGLQIDTRAVLFSPRGLIALIDIAASPPPPPYSAVSVPVSGSDPAPRPVTGENDLAPEVLAAHIPDDQQAFIHIQGTTLARLAASINSLPPGSRTLTLFSTDSSGKLFSRRRLGLGCGSHARLLDPGAVVGGLSVGAVRTRWHQGRLALDLPLWVEMQARAKVHVNGFPAPCGLTSPRPRCRCARGKTKFPVNGRLSEGVRLFGDIGFVSSPGGGVLYQIILNAPRELELSPRVQLGRLGSLPIPVSIPTPIGEVARGDLPLLLEQNGRIRLGVPPTVIKSYRLQLGNTGLKADQSGLAAGFSLSLEFSEETDTP